MTENMNKEKVIKVNTEVMDNDIDNVVNELENITNEEDIDDTEEEDIDDPEEEGIENTENDDDDDEDDDEDEDDDDDDDDDDATVDDVEKEEEDILNDVDTKGIMNNNIKLSDIIDQDDDVENVQNNIELNDDDENIDEDEEEIDDSYDDSDYYKKIEKETSFDLLSYYHPFNKKITDSELYTLINVVRNDRNIIIDPLHTTIPILTKYEKARILGVRAKQLNNGAMPFVKLNEDVIDSFLIAEKELNERKLPFIIQRPMPNGNSEYWKLDDLELCY